MSDTYRTSNVAGAGKSQSGQSSGQSSSSSDIASGAKDAGRSLTDKATSLAGDVTQVAKDRVAGLSDAAMNMAGDATQKVQKVVDEQKSAGADYLGGIAEAVNRAATELESGVPFAAQYVRQAAEQIDNVANAMRERNLSELAGEVQDFARRQPALFFGGALMLGFAAVRFFRSSNESVIPSMNNAGGPGKSFSGSNQYGGSGGRGSSSSRPRSYAGSNQEPNSNQYRS